MEYQHSTLEEWHQLQQPNQRQIKLSTSLCLVATLLPDKSAGKLCKTQDYVQS